MCLERLTFVDIEVVKIAKIHGMSLKNALKLNSITYKTIVILERFMIIYKTMKTRKNHLDNSSLVRKQWSPLIQVHASKGGGLPLNVVPSKPLALVKFPYFDNLKDLYVLLESVCQIDVTNPSTIA